MSCSISVLNKIASVFCLYRICSVDAYILWLNTKKGHSTLTQIHSPLSCRFALIWISLMYYYDILFLLTQLLCQQNQTFWPVAQA